jgi:hypothetical protein
MGSSMRRVELQVERRWSSDESCSAQRMELQLGSRSGCDRARCSRSSSPGGMIVAVAARELAVVDAAALVVWERRWWWQRQ